MLINAVNLTNYYINPPLIDLCSQQFLSIDSFDKFSKAINYLTELDFEGDYLFCMCSVVTNLVTSLEFQPIRSATMLFHFGRTRNGYVAIRFILLSGTVESSATSSYVVAPERNGQSEAWAIRKVERTRKKA